MAKNETEAVEDGLILRGKVNLRTRRDVGDNTVVPVTVLGRRAAHTLEVWNPQEKDIPALGQRVARPVTVNVFLDRSGAPRFSLRPAEREEEF